VRIDRITDTAVQPLSIGPVMPWPNIPLAPFRRFAHKRRPEATA